MRWLAVPFAFFATQAEALSCAYPDIGGTFQSAQESDDIFVVMHGQLSFDRSLLPRFEETQINPGDMVPIPARIEGRYLSESGFTGDIRLPVTLEVECIGVWCGSASTEVDVLAFLRQSNAGYVLTVGACPFWLIHEPSETIIATVEACMAGRECQDPKAPREVR